MKKERCCRILRALKISAPTSISRANVLAFATALITLALQILVHRIVSAKLLNNYAFLVISLTMLGFAFSGTLLSRWLPRLLEQFNEAVNLWASLFVISTIGVTLLFCHAGVGHQKFASRGEFVSSFFGLMPFALLYAVPFAFSGFILGMLLSAPGLPARRIYCSDLLGSACGALAVVPAITFLGVETSLLAACLLQWVVAVFLLPPRRWPVRGLLAFAALLIVTASLFQRWFFEMRHRDGSILAATQQPGSGYFLEHIAWDPVARIEVSRIPPPDPEHIPYPVLIGDNPAFLKRFKRIITQNNFAFTFAVEYDGDPKSLAGIDQTIYAAAYEATCVRHPRVATIGVGGGFDILTALYFEAPEITAVEINAATVKILTETYRDYFRACVADPRVHLVQAEGRHYLATTPRQFDVLQLSGVDSYSGTPGAANVFSENYLYTAEAFDLYLSRLTDQGVLNMMRLEYIPPREMLRGLTTAVAALRRAGATRPAHHIIMLTANEGNFTALLVKKKPFTELEEQRLSSWAATNKFLKVSAAPHLNPAQKNFYQSFLALDEAAHEQAYYAICPFNVTPVTDNCPFFFRYSFWRHLWPQDQLIRTTVPAMEISLTILFFLVGLAAIICVWVPLRLMGAAPGEGSRRWRYAVAFAGTALGYLAIEIALFQKFSLFLGHPNYALSVVLAVLLLSTGLGSLFSAPIVRTLRGAGMVSFALAGVLLLEHRFILPKLASWVALPFMARAMIVAGLVMPLGLLMGTFVPTALDRLKAGGDARFVPWAWGINGIFSVLAPVLSIGLSVTWGINVLLLTAIPLYLVVGLTFPPLPTDQSIQGAVGRP